MRNLLNRTIQFLTDDGQIEVLFREYFPGQEFPEETIMVWEGIGEEIRPQDYRTEIRFPAQYTTPRVLQSGLLRVGGLVDSAQLTTAGERRLAELNRALVGEIARRWGVTVQAANDGSRSAIEQLQAGAIDLVVGTRPGLAVGECRRLFNTISSSWRSSNGAGKFADSRI